MRKIDWQRKLTSRKLWMSIASFAAMMIVACGGAESQATQVTALIMAGATVIGYVIGEGLTDSAAIDGGNIDDLMGVEFIETPAQISEKEGD